MCVHASNETMCFLKYIRYILFIKNSSKYSHTCIFSFFSHFRFSFI